MMNSDNDDSDWADLASELGLETKSPPKPRYSAAPAGFEAQQTPGELPPFPAVPWPSDPNPVAEEPFGFAADSLDLPDALEPHDELDTLIDPLLSTEEFAPEDAEQSEGETGEAGDSGDPGDPNSPGGKRRRRRRRRRKGPNGEGGESADGPEIDAEGEIEPIVPAEPRTTADAIRDLVKTWTVPNWNEIVAGLYRPGGER